MDPIYLDYNATTPLDPAVVAAMRPYLETHFGNPSSSHVYGRRAREVVDAARGQMAALLGAAPEEIVFTGGGSESNNLAIRGAVRTLRERGDHIVTCAIEHPAVIQVCRHLEADGFRLTVVPVDAAGLVDPADVERALSSTTVLVTIMHANNEVGTIEPIAEISAITRRRGVLLHTDAAQTIGKIPTRADDLGVDLLSVAAHKFYGPKGVGALYVRRGVKLERLIHGADHERGLRAGTENVAGIVGLGVAAELARTHLTEHAAHMRALRDRLHEGLSSLLPGMRLNGHPERRLPNTLNVSIPGTSAHDLLSAVPEVAASAGAACHSHDTVGSATLAAMKVPADAARAAVRFSTGRLLTVSDVDRAIVHVAAAAKRQQS